MSVHCISVPLLTKHLNTIANHQLAMMNSLNIQLFLSALHRWQMHTQMDAHAHTHQVCTHMYTIYIHFLFKASHLNTLVVCLLVFYYIMDILTKDFGFWLMLKI